MSLTFSLTVLLAVLIALVQCNPRTSSFLYHHEVSPLTSECPGKPNTNTPWSGQLTKVKEVENGSLYLAGDKEDQIYVLHVYGSPYSMGYAHGTLLKQQIQAIIPSFFAHVESEVEQYLHMLPKDIRDLIAKLGLDGALDLTHILTEAYTPKYFYEEMHGIADAAGVDYDLILRVHMLPELVKAGCSMLGGWGKATANTSSMLQLRALDWDVDGPLQNAPTAVIYHPDTGNTFANVGWAGWIASISGMNSKGVAISEKHSDEPFGEESRIGVPFNFLMRDVLQFDNSLQDALRRIQEAHRTCSIWLGVGDGNEKTFRLIEYSRSTAKFFGDLNVTGINETRFNREGCDDACYHNYSMTDLVYWGVHLGCWNQVLHGSYGKLDPLTVIQLVGTVQTGDLQAVVYDLEQMQMYVSNARGDSEEGSLNAYDRQFVKLDMNELFKVPRPTFN